MKVWAANKTFSFLSCVSLPPAFDFAFRPGHMFAMASAGHHKDLIWISQKHSLQFLTDLLCFGPNSILQMKTHNKSSLIG